MKTVGPYTLLHRLGLGPSTESWLAAGPLQVTRVVPSMRDQPWVDVQLEWVRKGIGLPPPFAQTRFVGRAAGEALHVQDYRGGVPLREVLRGFRLPPAIAARHAIDLCDALALLPLPVPVIDDAQLRVGWDGALQLDAFTIDRVDPLDAATRDPVVRTAQVLSWMLGGQGVPGLPEELLRIVAKNLGARREPTCAQLGRALQPHAAPRDEALQSLAEHVRGRFVLTRSIDLARLSLCGVDVEPLPNDHVAKVYEGRDAEGDWLVLGDWFQGTSHPRGKLIALQGNAAEAGRLIRRSAELFVPHHAPRLKLAWRWGYVERAALYDLESAEALALILAHPSMRFVEELIIERGDEERIAMLLPEVTPPPTLTVLGLPRRTKAVVEAVRRGWPGLKRVERSVPDVHWPAHQFG